MVCAYLQECILHVGLLLNEHGVLLEKDTQEQRKVLNEVLFVLLSILVCLTDVGAQG